jgi:hypothetical protein
MQRHNSVRHTNTQFSDSAIRIYRIAGFETDGQTRAVKLIKHRKFAPLHGIKVA